MLAVTIIVGLTLCVACTIGYAGYLAFGAKTKSVILFNLPNDDPASITAKVFYILTIMGSFVIVANPVFRVIENSGWYRHLAGLKTPEKKEAVPMKDESPRPEADATNNEPDEAEGGGARAARSALSYHADGVYIDEDEDEPFTCCSALVYFGFRTAIVAFLCLVAFLIPSINILLTVGGALLGTVVNIVLPVIFYNRAYAFSEKNKMLEGE